ncbi:DUF6476 family protein [Pseudogemmobacter sp. W21_MBD1_M6]|uniref:DUF6476 family protein n=1 Tax=Pseudogemmobacter sp. W21_MBD1_M6 TaxID=3240271 RepID=UPI003F990FD7
MDDAPIPVEEPANLKFLRRLVTILTGTMIAGLVIIIGLIVIRFSDDRKTSAPALPDSIALPDGSVPHAFTQGGDWYAVVTASDQILIYDRKTGALRQTIQITK